MRILMEVTQKMKLYNVYRLCKQNIDSLINNLNIKSIKQGIEYEVNNWLNYKLTLQNIEKIPALKKYASEFINCIPDTVRHENTFHINNSIYNALTQNKRTLLNKMDIIIELYESMNIENDGYGIDIKLPPCEDLKEYISFLRDIDFIFSQCPFLQCNDEVVKFGAVDVGSNWLKLTVVAASTFYILTNTASLVDKALVLRSHYVTIQQQEEMLKSQEIKNSMAQEQIELLNTLRSLYVKQAISEMEQATEKTYDPEEYDKAERSLDKLIMLLDKGCEIYATLDSPEDVQALFPEIQTSLELPAEIINYLEEKDIPSEEH